MKSKGISEVIGLALMLVIVGGLATIAYFYFTNYLNIETSTVFTVVGHTGNEYDLTNKGTGKIKALMADMNGKDVPVYFECPLNSIFSDGFDSGTALNWTVVNPTWYVQAFSFKGDSTSTGYAESYANFSSSEPTVQTSFMLGALKPIDLMLVLDRSGSMGDCSNYPPYRQNPPCQNGATSKVNDSIKAAQSFVTNFDSSKDQLGLVSFNESITADSQLTSNFASVNSSIGLLKAAGNTNIGDAIYNATYILRTTGRANSAWVEVLLTDGQPNTPVSTGYALSYSVNASQNASAYGIVIYTIGLGSDVNATLLQQISSITGGQYFYAPNSSSLVQIYSQIAGALSTGSAGIILRNGPTGIAKVSISFITSMINLTDKNGKVVGIGYYTIKNNTFYTLKVVQTGTKMFVFINANPVVEGDVGDSSPINRLSLFSTNSLAVFDNVQVTDNSFDPGKTCYMYLYNFTSVPGTYYVNVRTIGSSFASSQRITVNVPFT